MHSLKSSSEAASCVVSDVYRDELDVLLHTAIHSCLHIFIQTPPHQSRTWLQLCERVRSGRNLALRGRNVSILTTAAFLTFTALKTHTSCMLCKSSDVRSRTIRVREAWFYVTNSKNSKVDPHMNRMFVHWRLKMELWSNSNAMRRSTLVYSTHICLT